MDPAGTQDRVMQQSSIRMERESTTIFLRLSSGIHFSEP